ncbi:MAG: hypothetical protein Terrestrivirus2_52 [Terrestrivirus sp.]|uniref:Uncharacterized protein n=1 Tax=Terrestrivirus sp. TaxID=2487775 RepID=A0A3G4ZMA7_9VIRU|nr:MAG: hypothetical protein Terrestrivirus2_52 [Terrestrivirus sp.]
MESTASDTTNTVLAFICICLVIIFIIIIGGFIVQVSWNVVMPEVFGLPDINLTKGIALFILANLLLGGFNMKYR